MEPHTVNTPKTSYLNYLKQGLGLSMMVVVLLQCWCMWQVYAYAQLMKDPQYADAAVVLGAAAWGEKPSPVFRERINHALTLYQADRVGKLIFTGGTPKSGFTTEAEVARRFAIKQGVSEYDILFENQSKDTYQNLVNTRLIMRKYHLNSVIIVTDPYHMARAMAMAQGLGIQAYPSPTPTSRYINASFFRRAKFFIEEAHQLLLYRLLYSGRRIGAVFIK